MSDNFFRINGGVELLSTSSITDPSLNIVYNNGTNTVKVLADQTAPLSTVEIKLPTGVASDFLISRTSSDTLQNKIINTTNNTIQINGVSLTDVTGTGSIVLANSPTLITPNLGTPSSVNLSNGTNLPILSGVSGLGAGVAVFLTTPTSANLASAITDETGTSGNLVFSNSPVFTTPNIDAATATSITGSSSSNLQINSNPTRELELQGNNVFVKTYDTSLATNSGFVNIKTGDQTGTASSGNIDINTGGSSSNVSGAIEIVTGDTDAFNSGNINIATGISNSASRGSVYIDGKEVDITSNTINFGPYVPVSTAYPLSFQYGANTSLNANLGNFVLSSTGSAEFIAGTGINITATSNNMNVKTGDQTGDFNSSNIDINSGNVSFSGKQSGYVSLYTGTANYDTGTSGNLSVSTGSALYSGNITYLTGAAQHTSGSTSISTGGAGLQTGSVSISTGSGQKDTGIISLMTGQSNSNPLGLSGGIEILTGNAVLGDTGEISIITGVAYNAGKFSGNIALSTGYGDGKSGDVLISTGSSTDQAGDVILQPGSASAGGQIQLNAPITSIATASGLYRFNDTAFEVLNGNRIDLYDNNDNVISISAGGAEEGTYGYSITLPTNQPLRDYVLRTNSSGQTRWDFPDYPYLNWHGFTAYTGNTSFFNTNVPAVAGSTFSAASFGTAAPYQYYNRVRVRASVQAANQQAQLRTGQIFSFGNQGWKAVITFAHTDALYNSGALQFHGIYGGNDNVGISSTVSVQSLINIIGVGSDIGDTVLSIYHNDATGTATKIPLNDANQFPANRTSGTISQYLFRLELFRPKTDWLGNIVYWRITNVNTEYVQEGAIEGDVMSDTTLFNVQSTRSSGSSSNYTYTDIAMLGCYTV